MHHNSKQAAAGAAAEDAWKGVRITTADCAANMNPPTMAVQGWEELMMVVESAMAGGRKEVALAAIGVVTTVTGAHGAGPAMRRPMWKRALRAMGVGVEAAVSPHCAVPLMARLELVAAVGQVQARVAAPRPPRPPASRK